MMEMLQKLTIAFSFCGIWLCVSISYVIFFHFTILVSIKFLQLREKYIGILSTFLLIDEITFHKLCIIRWEEEKKEDGVKWKFLEHKGPMFAPPYERLPSNIRMMYDGKYNYIMFVSIFK